MPGKKKTIQPLRPCDEKEDFEAAEFIRLNAPYLSLTDLRNALDISSEKLESLIHHFQIDMRTNEKEPRATDIAAEIGFMPIGTVIEQWERGTLIHFKSDIPGIKSITKHFADE